MKNIICLILIMLVLIIPNKFTCAQYCTPLYGFQVDSAPPGFVYSVQVDATSGSVYQFSTLERSAGVITSTLNINDKLMYYIESSISRFLPINSVTGEPLSSGIFNAEGIKELEYNCENNNTYGIRETNSGIELVTIVWQTESVNVVHNFGASNETVRSSAINATGDLIYMLTTSNTLYTFDIGTNTSASENLSVDIIEIEYDINDDVIYAYLADGSFGSLINGSFTQIGTEAIPPIGDIISTAFDPFTNTFFIANDTKLYAIDTESGNVVNEFNLNSPIHRLNAGIPCQIVADFFPDNTCIGLPVQFNDASIGATDWQWDFGDGAGTSTEQNPTYTYDVAGMYEVNLRVSGCELGTDDTTMVISVTDQPEVDLGDDVMACGESYRIDPGSFDPAFELRWTFGVKDSTTFNVTRDGSYWLAVQNGGCFGSDTIEVTLLDTPEVDLGADISVCETVDINLNAQNNTLEHEWSTGETASNITVNSTGIYWVEVSNAACSTRDSIEVKLFDALNVNLGEDQSICNDDFELDAGISGEGITYNWSNGATSQTITVDESGTYSVEVSSGDCSASDEVTINFDRNSTIDLGDDINACEGETIVLNAGNNGDSFLWSTGETTQTIDVNSAGDYSVEIEIGACTATASISVAFFVAPMFTLGENIRACGDTLISLSGPTGNDFEYMWSTGETTPSINVSTSGDYNLEVNNTGCRSSSSINVVLYPIPEIELGEDKTICVIENERLQLIGGSDFLQYSWSTGETTSNITITEPGIYSVTVQNENECTNSDAVAVSEQCAPKIFVPTAFSPNGDTQNDIFKPTVQFVENYALKIFNRYGQLMFSTTNVEDGWDGVFNNTKQPIGVFSWIVEYTTEAGMQEKQKGNLTLIR